MLAFLWKRKTAWHSWSVFREVCGMSCRLQFGLSGLNISNIGDNMRNVTRHPKFSYFSLLDTWYSRMMPEFLNSFFDSSSLKPPVTGRWWLRIWALESEDSSMAPPFLGNNTTTWEGGKIEETREHLAQYLHKDMIIIILIVIKIDIYWVLNKCQILY